MQTLTIQDLPHTEALDGKAMGAIQGGHNGAPSYWMSYYDGSKKADTVTALQRIDQNQEVFNANGNNVAFADGITSNVTTRQKGTNNIF